MFSRRALLSSALSCAALGGAGCGFGRRPKPPFRLVVTPWVGNAPFYVAKERRFFGEIDLRIASFGTDFDAWRALSDDRADFTTGTMIDILRGCDVGVDLQVPAVTDFSSGADGIVAAPGIQAVADLAGRRVGVEVGTLTHFVLIRALEHAGLTEDRVTVSNMSMDEAMVQLDAGKIDAAPFWEPYLGKAAAVPAGAPSSRAARSRARSSTSSRCAATSSPSAPSSWGCSSKAGRRVFACSARAPPRPARSPSNTSG